MKKLILIMFFAGFTVSLFAQNQVPGTVIAAPIVPNDVRDDYPTHVDSLGYGGARSVATIAARDAIKQSRRSEGMLVYVKATKQWFELGAGLTNSDWTIFGNISSAFAILDIAVRSDTIEHHLYPMVRAGDSIKFQAAFPDSLYYLNVSCFNRFGTVPYVINKKQPAFFSLKPVETCTCTYDAKQKK